MKRINGWVFHYKVIKNIGFAQNFNYILPKQTKISNFAYLNAELKNSKQIMNTSKGTHTHKRTALAGLLAGVLLTASCSYSEEKAIEQSVVSFAQTTSTCATRRLSMRVRPNRKSGCASRLPTSRRRMSTYTTLSATQPNATSSRLIWMTTRQRL